MEKCNATSHDCGTSMYCDITVQRCQGCHFICDNQHTPDFIDCQKHCLDFYKKYYEDIIDHELKPFTTNAASVTHPATISLHETTATISQAVLIVLIVLVVIFLVFLTAAFCCLTSKSKMQMTSFCWRKWFSFLNKQKIQVVYYMDSDQDRNNRRSSDCSQLEYIPCREEDMPRVQVAGAPMLQHGMNQLLHTHYPQHKSRKNSKAFDTGDESVVLIHNCALNKTSLGGKLTTPLNLRKNQEISNYNNGNMPGIPGNGNSDHNIKPDLANVSNNPTNNHNMQNLNAYVNPSTSKVESLVYNDDTNKQKGPKCVKTQNNLMNNENADNTRSDYTSYEQDSYLISAVEQVSVGVGSFTAEITPTHKKHNPAKVEDLTYKDDNTNRKVVTPSQRPNFSNLDGSSGIIKTVRHDSYLIDNNNNRKMATPSKRLHYIKSDQGTAAGMAVDSLSADVKGLPAPVNMVNAKSQVQTDKKQVVTINAAEVQNKDTLFAIDDHYSSHMKPDLAARELPHAPNFTEQSLLEVHRTGDTKNMYLLNEAITPKGSEKLLDNEEVLKNVQMRTYTEPLNRQVRRSIEQNSNGDTILKIQYTVDGELIPQQDNLMSTDPQQLYPFHTPVNQQNNMTLENKTNNMSLVNPQNNLIPVNKLNYLTHFNQTNPATVNNLMFPHGNGNPQGEHYYNDSGIAMNGQVESYIYTAPVYQTSELNAPVCQPSDIGVQPLETSKPVGDQVSKPKPHPNKRLYDVLKHIDWVDGYYSEGHSIEVYADLEHITPEVALKELSVRTGAPPEKFHIKQNDVILPSNRRD